MLRVLMLDLGETLVQGLRPFPGVPEALDTFRGFETEDGEPIALCLVSDFDLAPPPVTEEEVETIFQRYIGLLDKTGLRDYFEPVIANVTLSTHAGVYKPDRKVFDTAIQRLGISARLTECLFITEKLQHVEHCRTLGMQALQFGGHTDSPPPTADFTDWSEGVTIVAKRFTPLSGPNILSAVETRLRAMHPNWEILKAIPETDDVVDVQVRKWIRLNDPRLAELNGVHIQMPISVRTRLDEFGHLSVGKTETPAEEDLSEAVHHVLGLHGMHQIGTQAESSGTTTHTIITDSEGRRLLQRRRFRSY